MGTRKGVWLFTGPWWCVAALLIITGLMLYSFGWAKTRRHGRRYRFDERGRLLPYDPKKDDPDGRSK